MVPNKDLSNKVTESDTFAGSRAHSFLDSYIYMKKRNYNALYDKNKKIMLVENDAIKYNSPMILYQAFEEQLRILDSVIFRIQSFTERERQFIIRDIVESIPDSDKITQFQQSIKHMGIVPQFKYIKYAIVPINYPNMDQFLEKFKQEIVEYLKLNGTSNPNNPLLHSKATKYLTDVNIKYANYADSLFEIEEVKLLNSKRMNDILIFMRKSSSYISTLNKDFKTFNKYLKQFNILSDISDIMKPNITKYNVSISVDNVNYYMTFNDYLILYKHVSSMIKYLLEIVNLYNGKFFNKIYAMQTNIQVYKSIMDDVVMYVHNRERYITDKDETDIDFVGNNMLESSYEYMNQFKDIHDLINGNDEADMLLLDNSDDTEEYMEDEINNEEVCINALVINTRNDR